MTDTDWKTYFNQEEITFYLSTKVQDARHLYEQEYIPKTGINLPTITIGAKEELTDRYLLLESEKEMAIDEFNFDRAHIIEQVQIDYSVAIKLLDYKINSLIAERKK